MLRLGSAVIEVHDEWRGNERRYLSQAAMAKPAATDNHGNDDEGLGHQEQGVARQLTRVKRLLKDFLLTNG